MEGAYIILNGTFDFFAGFFDGFKCNFAVSKILKGIEGKENINSCFCCLCHKGFYYIIRVSFVAYQVLTAEYHF